MELMKTNYTWWKRFNPGKSTPAKSERTAKEKSQNTKYPRATNELGQTPKASILVPTATQLRRECPKSDERRQNRPKCHQGKSPAHS